MKLRLHEMIPISQDSDAWKKPMLVILPAALTMVGCGDSGTPATWSSGTANCDFPEAREWVTDESSFERTHEAGGENEAWFTNIAGIHVAPSTIFVYDAGIPSVLRFDRELRFLDRFGREGEGPGELRRSHRPLSSEGGSVDRIDGTDTAVAVYDQWNVVLFETDGGFERILLAVSPDVGLGPMAGRIALHQGGVLFGSGGYDPLLRRAMELDEPRYTVRFWRDDEVADVLELLLAPAPVTATGATFRGPNQAHPIWTEADGCIVATDGESPWLVVSSLSSTEADTVSVPLPDRDPPEVDQDEIRSLAPGLAGAPPPEPTAIRRIHDLILDPSGTVWILPIQPDPRIPGGVEVIRLSLTTGEAVVDTVPRFPRAFGDRGEFYATAEDDLGRVVLLRYVQRGADGG